MPTGLILSMSFSLLNVAPTNALQHMLAEFQLPLKSPVLVFSLILFIILLAPIVLGKIKVPGIIGYIISGIIIGPNGFNLLEKNSAVNLFSTIGLLYIMFIAGLELDMAEFKKKKYKSFTFGFFTFIIPLVLGFPICYYLLDFSLSASILTSSMFATHTLVAYPLASRYGISKNEAVAITVGGTILTDTAVLIILAVIIGSQQGSLDMLFWVQLIVSLGIFSFVMFVIIPRITRWFFVRLDSEKTSHFIFVLSVVFFAAFLAQLAGVEAIIGAFVAGLALNRLIPPSSILMNRIEFTGNALFIPFFLISVGMIVDVRVFLQESEALIIAGVLTTLALSSKWLAARLTAKVFRYSLAQSNLIFGLSSAHAAATLAIILVGYNAKIIDESVLNATIVLILITCIVASFATEGAAKSITAAQMEKYEDDSEPDDTEKILVAVADFARLEQMVDLASLMKEPSSSHPIHLLSVVHNNESAENNLKEARKKLEGLQHYASAADTEVQIITTLDYNAANGVSRTSKEISATTLLLGWPRKTTFLNKFMSDKTETIIENTERNILICHLAKPVAVHDRIVLICPYATEHDPGFHYWLSKVCMLAKELSAPVYCQCRLNMQNAIVEYLDEQSLPITFHFRDIMDWDNAAEVKKRLKPDDLCVFVAARKESLSYHKSYENLQKDLEHSFAGVSRILIYPQSGIFQRNKQVVAFNRLDETDPI